MSETLRVTFVQHVYQEVDFPAAEVRDLTDEEITERARKQLRQDYWHRSGDSMDIELNGIDLLPEGAP